MPLLAISVLNEKLCLFLHGTAPCGAIEDGLIKDIAEIIILGSTPVKHHYQLWLSSDGSGNSPVLRGPILGGQH
jgi:hypothetical protein